MQALASFVFAAVGILLAFLEFSFFNMINIAMGCIRFTSFNREIQVVIHAWVLMSEGVPDARTSSSLHRTTFILHGCI
jgi:hypothetical protein